MVIVFLNFGSLHTFSKLIVPIYILGGSVVYVSSFFPITSPTLVITCSLNDSYLNRYEVIFHCGGSVERWMMRMYVGRWEANG